MSDLWYNQNNVKAQRCFNILRLEIPRGGVIPMCNDTPNPSVIQIPLNPSHHGLVAIVDKIDADLLRYAWKVRKDGYTHYAFKGSGRNTRYGTTKVMHRLILERIIGRPLAKGEICDHKDLDGLNNRRSNLRLATKETNAHNRRLGANNTSGFKGVCWDKRSKRWIAQIYFNKKRIGLGYHRNILDAARAYNRAALEHFGEFARLNIIPE